MLGVARRAPASAPIAQSPGTSAEGTPGHSTASNRLGAAAPTLRNSGELILWLQEAGLLTPGAPDPADATVLASGRQLREAVDRAVLAVADGRLPHPPTSSCSTDRQRRPRTALRIAVTDGCLEPAGTTSLAADPTAAPALVAQNAVDLLLSAKIRRVCICGADTCALRFLDRSPAHNRR
ncbi:CGNR zinc finger domain-containing protein [Streptomyces sp. LZ34]